jgi:hypothetical protein
MSQQSRTAPFTRLLCKTLCRTCHASRPASGLLLIAAGSPARTQTSAKGKAVLVFRAPWQIVLCTSDINLTVLLQVATELRILRVSGSPKCWLQLKRQQLSSGLDPLLDCQLLDRDRD